MRLFTASCYTCMYMPNSEPWRGGGHYVLRSTFVGGHHHTCRQCEFMQSDGPHPVLQKIWKKEGERIHDPARMRRQVCAFFRRNSLS